MANQADAIEEIGLGVDLIGGPETLVQLRAIRVEMEAIISLSGRGPSGPGGPGASLQGPISQASLKDQERLAQAHLAATRVYTEEEINILARAENQKLTLRQQVKTRAAEQASQEATQRAATLQAETEHTQKLIAERKARIDALARQNSILRKDLGPELRSFQAARNDPARDEQTNIYRRQIAEEIQAQRLGRRLREQGLIDRRARVEEYSRDPNILNENLGSQLRSFQRYRNDPARDEQTNIYRREISERIQAQRIARTRDNEVQRAAAAEQALKDEADRQVQANRARNAEIQRRSYDTRVLNRRIDPSTVSQLPASLRGDIEIDLAAQQVAKRRETDAREQALFEQEKAQKNRELAERRRQIEARIEVETRGYEAEVQIGNLKERARVNAAKTTAQASLAGQQADAQVRDFRTIEATRGGGASGRVSLISIEEEKQRKKDEVSAARSVLQARQAQNQADAHIRDFRRLGGVIPPGGPPPEEEETGGRGGGLASQVGRITRNFILYRILGEATFGLVRYTEESLKAAKATSEQGNALLFATDAAHGNLEANRALAEQIGVLGFNRAEARQVVATAARATYRHPELTQALVKEATDIAALRGGGINKTPEVIEDIIGGRDRSYRELLNITPEEIYKEAGKKHLAQQTNLLGLKTVGKQDYETDQQRINKYVAALTEQEKEELRLNYVLSQSFRFQGDAAERATTLAGKMDLVSAGFYNASANVGAFITELRPVKNLLNSLSNLGPGELFTPPELKRGGPRNTITDANISEYVADKIRAYDVNLESVASPPGFGTLPKSGVTINPATIIDKLFKLSGEGLFTPPVPKEISDTQYDAIINENIAKAQQAKQRAVLEQQGQIGYRALNPGDGPVNQYFTYEELTAKGLDSDAILKNYIKDIKPVLLDGQQALIDYRKEYARLQDIINAGVKAGDESSVNAATKAQQLLAAKEDARFYAGFAPPDVEQHFAESEAKRRQKEEQERQKYINRLGRDLGVLRQFQEGSFRIVGEVANTLEPGNPFVRPLADIATTKQRVQSQFGPLGPKEEEYYTKLYTEASRKELTKLDFQSFRASTTQRNQIAREADLREGPGLSRQQQDYLDIQQQIVNQAIKIPELWKEAAQVLGITIGPQEDLLNQVTLISRAFGARGPISGPTVFDTNIFGANSAQYKFQKQFGNPLFLPGGQYEFQRRSGNPLFLPGGAEEFQRTHGNPLYESSTNPLANIGAGQSPDVRQALQKSFSDSLLDAFKNYTPAQIRSSGLQSYYLGALQVQASQLPYNIEQTRLKAELGAKEDSRLQKQLAEDETFRQRQIAAGADADTVGQSTDELVLARTEGISPKDLSFRQFKARQDAQERQVVREENKRKDAEKAVEEGKKAQLKLNTDVGDIRKAIYEGKLSMLVQVENNTQAAIDEANLGDMAQGRYNIPMDNSKTRTSPYSDSYERYNRGGRKR